MAAPKVIPHPTIALLRSASLSSAAQQEIERLILDGELAPGAKLAEAWLSERLGVSRGPIREAFRMLEEAGLVRQEKNRGVFVRDIPVEEAMEIYDLRAVMDELAGRRLAGSIAPEQLKRARTIVDGMDEAARSDDAGRAMFEHVMQSKERALKGEASRAHNDAAPLRARAGRKG